MLVNGQELIRKQLELTEAEEITFPDGRKTLLTPVSFVPVLSGAATRLSLNGDWQVARWPFAEQADRLVAPEADDGAWETAEQPGKVFYGAPEEDPASVPDWNRVTLDHIDPEDGAVIRRTVLLPAAWTGKRIHLRFNSIYPAGDVYVDGALLGVHTSGLTPVEWDVTDRVEPGRSVVVAVRLRRRHKFVQMDMPRHALEFAGLAQEAFFHATEPCGIADFHLLPELDDACRHGRLTGSVQLRNWAAAPAACRLTVSVARPDGGDVEQVAAEATLGAGESGVLPLEASIRDVALWNDESPALHSVSLRLEVEGQAPQEVRCRTGFRRFAFEGERPTLNGRPIKFRGVNHLTYHPEFGMHTPKEWLRQCLTLMKRANVNSIRTHFLGPPALAELCDEMGFYLLQELPIDWGTRYIHDPEWVGPALTRIEGGVRRDRHHPSVMVWSVGNENMPWDEAGADDGWNHLRIYDEFVKTLDPTRPTMFPPPGPANKVEGIFELRVGDVADIHYSFKLIKRLHEEGRVTNPRTWSGQMETTTREEALANGWSGVWFSSEYGIFNYQPDLLNAPYLSRIADVEEDILSGANTMQVFSDRLEREWGLMRDDPTCLGGAYFPWLCSGTGDNPWGWVRWGEDADWGVVTADLLPKPGFWALRVIFSPVRFPERLQWRTGQTELEFEVTNGYNSIDLEQCTLRTMMAGGGKWMGSMRSWQDVPVACPPGETATVRIPIWNPQTLAGLGAGLPVVCRCTLLDPTGFRPITADIIVEPPEVGAKSQAMPIGPDAV